MDSVTLPRIRQPSVLLVGFLPATAEMLRGVVAAVGYHVLAVAHVPAACERIPIAMPRIVVARSKAKAHEAELADRTTAVGATLLWIPEDADDATIIELVKTAVLEAGRDVRR